MNAAICGTEKAEREQLGKWLTEKMEGRREPLNVFDFECGEDLLWRCEEENVRFDLIIQDIRMKKNGLNGLDTARRLRDYDRKTAIIFLSDRPDYVTESYAVHACYYLLRPVKKDAFEAAINRFMEDYHPKIRQSLLMISGSSGRRIAYDDIIYIESRRMNLRVVCTGGAEHIIRKKLGDVQAELSGARFLRCNQSFIVNMDYVENADVNFTMSNGDQIPIKVRERKRIREQYFEYARRKSGGF